MRLATLFSGIGAPEQGAIRVHDDLEMVFACEWDKFARQSFEANYDIAAEHFHKDVHDLDGTKYLNQVDVLIGGSPCQAFSIAGLRNGTEDERGQLIYQYIRVVDEVKAPVIVYENVKGMMSIGGGRTIKEFVQALREIGYYCHYEVVNTKDYGVPQNRERIFLVGFLDHAHYHRFEMAVKVPLTKRLKDVLEDDVDDKYYITEQQYEIVKNSSFVTTRERLQDGDVHRTCCARDYKDPTLVRVPSATKLGFETATTGDSINLSVPNSKTRIGRVGKQVAQTLDTQCNQDVVEEIEFWSEEKKVYSKCGNVQLDYEVYGEHWACDKCKAYNLLAEPKTYERTPLKFLDRNQKKIEGDYAFTVDTAQTGGIKEITATDARIRKLTPRECLRLQDFPDTFKQVCSDSQQYKQAGNSMSVNILEMIFRQIEKAQSDEPTGTLLDFC